MSGRGGGFSRGGGRGGGGGFRGGRGAGRGGSAPRERSAGRDATSIDSLFNKNTRYDHRVAKEKKFWDKSKRLREYHGLLRAEGFEGKRDHADMDDGEQDHEQEQQARPAKKAHTVAASSSAASSSIPTLLPDVFASANDPLALMPTESHNKQRKRPRADLAGGAASTAAAAGDSSSATARSASSSLRAGGPLDPSMPDFKRRRLTAAEKAEIVAAKHARHEAKRALLNEKVDQRRELHTRLTERTTRGQPVMKNQVEYLLQKLQKQAAATETAAKAEAAAKAAAAAAAEAAAAKAAREEEEEPVFTAAKLLARPAALPKKAAAAPAPAPTAIAPTPASAAVTPAAAAGSSSKKKQKQKSGAAGADAEAHKPAAAAAATAPAQSKSKPAATTAGAAAAPKAKAATPKPAAAAAAPSIVAGGFDPGFKKKKKPNKAERMAMKLKSS